MIRFYFIFMVFEPRLLRVSLSKPSHPCLEMSRLNASAFEFVPGRRFVPPSAQQQPQQQLQPQSQPQPPAPPFERPEEPDAPPAPPPTISLNIGGAKRPPAAPTAPSPAARDPAPAHAPSAAHPPAAKPNTHPVKAAPAASSSTPTPSRTPGSASPAPGATPSKTFTMGRAKTDTAAIAQEVAAVADQEVLNELFGDSASPTLIIFRKFVRG